VQAQIERLRSVSYSELREQRDEPVHFAIRSGTGRQLMGEAYVRPTARSSASDLVAPRPVCLLGRP
jgi:hypothetical protein